jgi:hypothetical protein
LRRETTTTILHSSSSSSIKSTLKVIKSCPKVCACLDVSFERPHYLKTATIFMALRKLQYTTHLCTN